MGLLLKYFRKNLFQVIFHVTFRCNAKCGFCFNWRDINTGVKPELSIEEIEKISKSMPSFPWLMISGGEPVLRADLADIIIIFYKNNKIRHVTLPTNGIASGALLKVCSEVLAKCRKLSLTVSFSLDGLGADHDEMRNVKGCYDFVMKSFSEIKPLRKDKRLNVKFHTVVTSGNYTKLGGIIDLVKSMKPDMHTIEFVRGDLKDKNICLPPQGEIPAIIKQIKDNYEYYGGYSNLKSHLSPLNKLSKIIQREYLDLCQEIFCKKEQVMPCLAHKLSLVIYPYGDVSFCEPLKQFGNIKDYGCDYRLLIKSEPAKKQAGLIKRKQCYCYHPCFQYLNIVFSRKRMAGAVLKNVF